MTRKNGFQSWPPLWTSPDPAPTDKPQGEVGILDEVDISHLIEKKLFLFIIYRDHRYMGMLGFDDETFCSQLYTLLKSKLGHSIREIGDLDVSQLV